jgi:asparagine synthase (glutamine-hydrolysing)
MPGIAGLITQLPKERAVALLCQMVKALAHEPFYETGIWMDEPLGIYVGWAVRKGSFCDRMPVTNETGSVTLVLSGEVYPAAGTIEELKAKGHSFDERPAAYLPHLCEEEPDFPLSLNGLFHGIVADRKRGTVALFNDRYGMHKLCYHQSSEAFYFAAEAKAILAVRPELRTVDERSLGEFVACSCVLGNRTVFKRIQVLPGGSAWFFRNAEIDRKTTYFEAREWENQVPLDPESYYRELRDTFARNLQLYFAGREQAGMTLTGGMDTRLIMAWHKSPPGSLPCYTFGGVVRECHDVRIARRIADLCKQPYQVIPIGEEFLAQFPRYAERSVYLTEGGVDVYRASDLYVSERARRIAPAKVVGTYGSEIVRHAVMFKAVTPPAGLLKPDFLPFIRQAQETYSELRREHPLTFAAFHQSPWYHQGILALENSQLTVRSPYLDNDFVRTVFRAPQNDTVNGDIRLRLIKEGDPILGRMQTDLGFGGNAGVFSKISRAMLHFTFKAEYAYDYGMPQWLSRTDNVLSAFHLERMFLGRHKVSHFRIWYKDALSKYVREILLDERTLSRPYLERGAVEAVVEGHTRRGLNYTSAIHKLLSVELLHRVFFDAQPAASPSSAN